MAISSVGNGNKTFRLHNDITVGTSGSAHFQAMLLAGHERAELRIYVHGHEAEFTKTQLETIADHLLQLAAEMPDSEQT